MRYGHYDEMSIDLIWKQTLFMSAHIIACIYVCTLCRTLDAATLR